MNKDKIVRDLGDLAKTYGKMNRKKYEVKTSIVLDKKEPANLKLAYLVIMLRDPKQTCVDKYGIRRKDKTWNFAFKTRKGCFEMKQISSFRWSGFFRVEPVDTHKIGWIEGSKERLRFNYFAQNHKICTKIHESLNKEMEVATARYFESLNITEELDANK